MSTISLAILNLHLYMPENQSLKQKRGIIKPILAKLHHDYNLSASEVDHLNSWKESLIVCAVVSNDSVHNEKILQKAATAIESAFPHIYILDQSIEFI